MGDVQIRLANDGDLDAVFQLIQGDAFVFESGSRDDYARAFAEVMAHPDNELVVATLDGEVVGTLQLTFIPGLGIRRRALVESVRVRQDVRNLRIGTRLMEWVFDRARGRQCSVVQLTTNVARKDAQRFYQRLGFKPTHVGMKLFLTPPI
jgi:GNAT superfamily N-acetyltransferase